MTNIATTPTSQENRIQARSNIPFVAIQWGLKSLLYNDTYRKVYKHIDGADKVVLDTLKIDQNKIKSQSYTSILKKIKAALAICDELIPNENTFFAQNITGLQASLSLTNAESCILAYYALLPESRFLNICRKQYIDEISRNDTVELLASIFDLPWDEITRTLDLDGKLFRYGLLEFVQFTDDTDFRISAKDNLGAALCTKSSDVLSLFSDSFKTVTHSELTTKDYAYIKDECCNIENLLKSALKQSMAGVNILLYGKPGTGKTQLVSTINKCLNTDLFEVSSSTECGKPINKYKRLMAYKLCQGLLSGNQNNLIIFDETEDLFPNSFLSFLSDDKDKAWINNILETNSVPTFWVSNDISNMDPAFLRRFAYILEMPNTPSEMKENILEKELKETPVDSSLVKAICEVNALSPGHLKHVSRSTRMILESNNKLDPNKVVSTIVNNSLKANNQPELTITPNQMDIPYKLEYLNADVNPKALVKGLAQYREGRLFLYGPPGTGKSAYAKYVATQLDIPLHSYKASDYLDKYVGKTEQKIARSFQKAKSEGALLHIDEADSFLYSREGASQGWQITLVNELLTQIEAFNGILICTTNRLQSLDPAVLRRFDSKINLDYLSSGQAWELFMNTFKGNKATKGRQIKQYRDRLKALENLAPGDFAVAERKTRLIGKGANPDAWISILEKECALKPDAPKQTIGFY